MFMRKIWTRLATLALILVVTISFSACSLFATDLDKKYSDKVKVLTAANDDISVSRQELYNAYLQWGYQYASYYSSQEDLLKYIANSLMNSKILEKHSIELFGDLRDSEKALALQSAYKTLDNTIRSYVYDALGKDDEDKKADEEKDDEVDKPYEPSILISYENGERVFTLDLSSYVDEDGTGTLALSDYEYYAPAEIGGASAKNIKQAVSKILRNLQSLEKGFTQLKTPERDYLMPGNEYFKYLTKAERAVINREIERMYESNKTSILTERISVAYNLGLTNLSGNEAVQAWDAYLNRSRNFAAWCDSINQDAGEKSPGRVVATNIANKAIEYYQQKVTDAINNQKNFPKSDLEESLMKSGLADVYYIPQDVANKLFNVSHILIGFTKEQKAEYKRIQNDKDPAADPDSALNDLYAETKSDGVTAYDILLELQTALGNADSLEEKYHIFREYINQYNSDPGMQNLDQLNSESKPQYEYLMSSTKENNTMVESFTNASLELFENGHKGEISGLVWSEYGAHIIMYTRDISEFIYTGIAESLSSNYADTLFASLTSYGKRTKFDTLVDSYFTRDYSNYRTLKLKEYKNEHKITIVDSEFKKFL